MGMPLDHSKRVCVCARACVHACVLCVYVSVGCKFVLLHIVEKEHALGPGIDLEIPDDAWFEELKDQLQGFKVPCDIYQTCWI